MIWVIIVVGIVLCVLSSYTMIFQESTLIVGRLLAGGTPNGPGTGVQNAITSRSQSIRNFAMLGLAILLGILVILNYAWFHVLWVLLACFILSIMLKVVLKRILEPQHFLKSIMSDLQSKHEVFINSGDNIRADAVYELLERAKSISPEDVRQVWI